ncbi:MAG TPA: RsmD family RNA methyltransferase, partial [Gammaproteobacteria bacterium]
MPARSQNNRKRARDRNRVRIIGGEWRGRIIEFVDAAELRPTKDLVRETLFNWLQPRLPGSRCLDAFAGSGALGFEAA